MDPWTDLVGSMSKPMTFIVSFALLLSLLAAPALPNEGRPWLPVSPNHSIG